VAFLSPLLAVPRRDIVLVSGERSRDKRLRIDGLGAAEAPCDWEPDMTRSASAVDTLILDIDRLVTCAGPVPAPRPRPGQAPTVVRAARWPPPAGQIVFAGTTAECLFAFHPGERGHRDRRARLHGPSRLRRSPHPCRLRRRSPRRAAPPPRRRHLRGDRGGRRRHRLDRSRDARGHRGRTRGARRPRLAEMLRQGTARRARSRAATGWRPKRTPNAPRNSQPGDGDADGARATFMGAHEVPVEHRHDRGRTSISSSAR